MKKLPFSFFFGFFIMLVSLACQSDEDPLPKEDFVFFKSEGKAFLFTQIHNTDWNRYFRGERQDQIGIAFQNEEQTLLAGINILDAFIWKSNLPLKISGPLNDPFQPLGDFQLIDLTTFVPITFGPEDGLNFKGSTSNSQITYVLEKYQNDILEGSFSGTIFTQTGESKEIESGKFRVKIPENFIE